MTSCSVRESALVRTRTRKRSASCRLTVISATGVRSPAGIVRATAGGGNRCPRFAPTTSTLYCEVDGEGEPVTVVAHGLTNNRNELAAFTPYVPGTKVRFDFRGHGRSSSPATGFRFEDFARDVDAVASAYGATVAIGTSLGAGAIGNLVCRVPDRFERMVWLLPAGLDLPLLARRPLPRARREARGQDARRRRSRRS